MEVLAIESLSVEEVRAMDLRMQVDALSDCLHASIEFGRELISATTQLSRARVSVLRAPSVESKSQVIMAKSVFDALKIRAGTLREMRSILQSLIRSASV
jgi:hypothetical protein